MFLLFSFDYGDLKLHSIACTYNCFWWFSSVQSTLSTNPHTHYKFFLSNGNRLSFLWLSLMCILSQNKFDKSFCLCHRKRRMGEMGNCNCNTAVETAMGYSIGFTSAPYHFFTLPSLSSFSLTPSLLMVRICIIILYSTIFQWVPTIVK